MKQLIVRDNITIFNEFYDWEILEILKGFIIVRNKTYLSEKNQRYSCS